MGRYCCLSGNAKLCAENVEGNKPHAMRERGRAIILKDFSPNMTLLILHCAL